MISSAPFLPYFGGPGFETFPNGSKLANADLCRHQVTVNITIRDTTARATTHSFPKARVWIASVDLSITGVKFQSHSELHRHQA